MFLQPVARVMMHAAFGKGTFLLTQRRWRQPETKATHREQLSHDTRARLGQRSVEQSSEEAQPACSADMQFIPPPQARVKSLPSAGPQTQVSNDVGARTGDSCYWKTNASDSPRGACASPKESWQWGENHCPSELIKLIRFGW